jgi:hypothetical protein
MCWPLDRHEHPTWEETPRRANLGTRFEDGCARLLLAEEPGATLFLDALVILEDAGSFIPMTFLSTRPAAAFTGPAGRSPRRQERRGASFS